MPKRAKQQPKVTAPAAATPLPRLVRVGFRVGMYILGFAMIGVFVLNEMRGHTHGVGAWVGHTIMLGFAAGFMLVGLVGLAKTVTFVQGLATAWKKVKD